MSTESDLYSLIFEGLIDDSPAVVQKLKGVFIADLDLSIPEVQRILNTASAVVCTGNDLNELKTKSDKLSAIGALVNIISLRDTEEEEDQEDGTTDQRCADAKNQNSDRKEDLESAEAEEFVFELDLDENEKPKPKRKVIHKVSEDISLSDTLKELGIAEEQAPQVPSVSKIELPPIDNELSLALVSEPVNPIPTDPTSKTSGIFSDLTIKDVDSGLELVEELVKLEAEVEESLPPTEIKSVEQKSQEDTEELDLSLTLDEPPKNTIQPEVKVVAQTIKVPVIESESTADDSNDFGLLLEEPNKQQKNSADIAKIEEPQENILNEVPVAAKQNLVELTEVIPTTVEEIAPRLADLAKNKQELVNPTADLEKTTVKKTFHFKILKNNLDSIVAILVGGILLGVANYYYFQEPNQQNSSLEQARVANDIKQALKTNAKDDKEKQANTWTDIKFENVTEKENFKVVSNFILLKNGLRLEKFEVTTPKPMELSEEEIIAGVPPHPWLTKITTEPVMLELSGDSSFNIEIPIKAFAIINKKNIRYLSKAKLSGNYDKNNQEILARLEFEYNLTAGSEDVIFIEKADEDQLSFAGKINIKTEQNSR